jgi:hypothetical protein
MPVVAAGASPRPNITLLLLAGVERQFIRLRALTRLRVRMLELLTHKKTDGAR